MLVRQKSIIKVIWENILSKTRTSDTTQNIVGKAVIPTLRLFDMLISSKKSVVDLKKAKQLCCVILKFQECVFHNLSSRDGNRLFNPRRTSSLSVDVQLRALIWR